MQQERIVPLPTGEGNGGENSKAILRKEIKKCKRQFTEQQLSELSFAVIMRLLANSRLKDAETVLLYYSLPDEVDTHTLVDALLASKKRVLLPRVTGEGTMELRLYNGPQSLARGAYNIMEPIGAVFDDYDAIDLAVIPGVAFDHEGNRMGRGKGYYDRLLPHLTKAYKIGICFDFQLVDGIECEAHDVKMDEVVSTYYP